MSGPTLVEAALHDPWHHAQVHADLTAQILYPMLERAAGAAGENAAARPRQELDEAIRGIERVLRRGAAPEPDETRSIAELVRPHIDADETEVVPLLRAPMDGARLAALRDAPATAMKSRVA